MKLCNYTFHIPLKCFKALDDILDVKPEKMHLNKLQQDTTVKKTDLYPTCFLLKPILETAKTT